MSCFGFVGLVLWDGEEREREKGAKMQGEEVPFMLELECE